MAPGGEFDRRSFLVGASAAGGGLALGFALPFEAAIRAVADGGPAKSRVGSWSRPMTR